jgi:hypothetical protein
MKTFLQTYPIKITQKVFVTLALPCQPKPQGKSPGFWMNVEYDEEIQAFLEKLYEAADDHQEEKDQNAIATLVDILIWYLR